MAPIDVAADPNRSVLKRLTDIFVALPVLIVAAPLILLTMILIVATMGRPTLFIQQRTGRAGRRFGVIKLRTMTGDRDATGAPLPDAMRTTALGRLLRRYSVDELPELVNVICGDMSLVGPRPLLPRYDAWYTERERLRFAVRPGITGLAQLNGRNTTRWDDRLEWDVRYVTEWSYRLDLRILARTGWNAIRGTGVAVDPTALMQDLDEERKCRQ